MAGGAGTARRIAQALTLSLQAARLHPAGHPLRDRRRAELAEALADSARDGGPVELDVRGLVLAVGDGESVSLAEEPFRSLAEAASNAGLRRVVLPAYEGLQRAEDLIALLLDARARTGEESTRPIPASEESKVRDLVDDLLDSGKRDSAGPEGRAPTEPVCRDGASLTGRLETIWRGVALTRRLDADALHDLGEELASIPGDGHLEPVRLLPGSDPREATIAQAINASRLFGMCLRAADMQEVESLCLLEASLLADVGMLLVPADVISHQGRLDEAAFAQIARHPVDGARMLLATPGAPLDAGVLAFEHHMRRAGRGYPRAHAWGIAPLTGLFQVCDTYAALRSERAYRSALDEEEARATVRRMGDVWFDGRWVALLLDTAAPEGARAAGEPMDATSTPEPEPTGV